jgi:hypothetical protein
MTDDAASIISTAGSRKRASVQDESGQGRALKPRSEYSIGGMDQPSTFTTPLSIARPGYYPSAAMFGKRPTSQGPVFPPLAPTTLAAPPPFLPSSGPSSLAGIAFASSPAGFGLQAQARPTGAIGAAPAPLPIFGHHSSPSPFSGVPRPLFPGFNPSGMAQTPVSLFPQSSSSPAMAIPPPLLNNPKISTSTLRTIGTEQSAGGSSSSTQPALQPRAIDNSSPTPPAPVSHFFASPPATSTAPPKTVKKEKKDRKKMQ